MKLKTIKCSCGKTFIRLKYRNDHISRMRKAGDPKHKAIRIDTLSLKIKNVVL